MIIDEIPIGEAPPWDINVIIEVPFGREPVKYEMDKKSPQAAMPQNYTAFNTLNG